MLKTRLLASFVLDTHRADRICLYCRTGKTETEEHFLFECPNYEEQRRWFIGEMTLLNQKYNRKMGKIEFLNEVFRSKDINIFNTLGRFLQKCWETRSLMGSNSAKVSNLFFWKLETAWEYYHKGVTWYIYVYICTYFSYFLCRM